MRFHSLCIFKPAAALLISMMLTACGGGTEGTEPADPAIINTAGAASADADGPTMAALAVTFSVGGKVHGIDPGKSIVLVNKGGNPRSLSADGPFVFSKKWTPGTTYNVSVSVPPAGQTCEVLRPSGTIWGGNVTDVRVLCTPTGTPATYTLGGTLTGLGAGKTLSLQDGAGHALSLSAAGAFTFPTPLPNGAAYAVTVSTLPVGQSCTVTNGTGTISSANVTNVSVACVNTPVPTYSIGGNVSGLGTGKFLVLSNAGSTVTVSASGPFIFSTPFVNGSAYTVTVSTLPVGQTCTVSNGTGTISSANVTNVSVACVTTGAIGWSNFTTTATTLVLNSNEALNVNSPFYGIQVTRNGKDITDDITDIATLSPTSWRYTFKTEKLNEPGEAISVSLQNAQLAVPGHYISWPEPDPAKTVQSLYARLVACEAGVGECAGTGAIPNLITGAKSIKGFSKKYYPRDMEKTDGSYDFSPIFADAIFLASKQLKLNVIFIGKSFSKLKRQNGNGSNKVFDIPNYQGNIPSAREVRVFVNGNMTSYTFNADKTKVQLLGTAPPAGVGNVVVAHALDPFPNAAWAMSPPVGDWYLGDHPDHPTPGIAHAPWRPNCVEWMGKFMAGFQAHWTAAIAANPAIDKTIESVSVQESYINPSTDYSEANYRAGLVEYAKFYARAVRRRAVHEQLINFISGGIGVPNVIGRGLDELTGALIPWGSRFGGPDLLSDSDGSGDAGLEFGPYTHVHRARHNQALTMIWAQNDSFSEPNGDNFFTMTKQFEKAQKSITDTSNAKGYKGLGVDYVFWNMTDKNPDKPGSYDWRDALKVISNNPIIQTTGADRNRWRKQSSGIPISDQSLSKVN